MLQKPRGMVYRAVRVLNLLYDLQGASTDGYTRDFVISFSAQWERILDVSKLQHESISRSFHGSDGLVRVGQAAAPRGHDNSFVATHSH